MVTALALLVLSVGCATNGTVVATGALVQDAVSRARRSILDSIARDREMHTATNARVDSVLRVVSGDSTARRRVPGARVVRASATLDELVRDAMAAATRYHQRDSATSRALADSVNTLSIRLRTLLESLDRVNTRVEQALTALRSSENARQGAVDSLKAARDTLRDLDRILSEDARDSTPQVPLRRRGLSNSQQRNTNADRPRRPRVPVRKVPSPSGAPRP